jgi:hypothetical protein
MCWKVLNIDFLIFSISLNFFYQIERPITATFYVEEWTLFDMQSENLTGAKMGE